VRVVDWFRTLRGHGAVGAEPSERFERSITHPVGDAVSATISYAGLGM
jgi:hypothetical protein